MCTGHPTAQHPSSQLRQKHTFPRARHCHPRLSLIMIPGKLRRQSWRALSLRSMREACRASPCPTPSPHLAGRPPRSSRGQRRRHSQRRRWCRGHRRRLRRPMVGHHLASHRRARLGRRSQCLSAVSSSRRHLRRRPPSTRHQRAWRAINAQWHGRRSSRKSGSQGATCELRRRRGQRPRRATRRLTARERSCVASSARSIRTGETSTG